MISAHLIMLDWEKSRWVLPSNTCPSTCTLKTDKALDDLSQILHYFIHNNWELLFILTNSILKLLQTIEHKRFGLRLDFQYSWFVCILRHEQFNFINFLLTPLQLFYQTFCQFEADNYQCSFCFPSRTYSFLHSVQEENKKAF